MVGSQQPAKPPLSPLASPGVQAGETQAAQNASRRSLGGRGGSRKGATLSELMSQRSLQVGPGLLCSARLHGSPHVCQPQGGPPVTW